MAGFEITSDDTEWDGMDSNGVLTATRYITVSDGSGKALDFAESNVIPSVGDAHPEHANWTVESIGKPRHSDIPKEYRLEIKYRKISGSPSGNISSETKPWELGVVNFRTSFTTTQAPLTSIYIPNLKEYRSLTNAAGQVIPAMRDIFIRVLSFSLNYEIRNGKRQSMDWIGSYNAAAIKVCGETIPAYAGKLANISAEEHKVYKNNGKDIKWHYETVNYEIQIMQGDMVDPDKPDSKNYIHRNWAVDFLNVGNMAIFETPEGEIFQKQIFRYTPWVSTDPAVNAKVVPKFGSIDDVIAARNAYKKATGDTSKEIPWEEAQDIPLTKPEGTIDQEAIDGTKAYTHISGYDSAGKDWTKLNLPKEI